MRKLCLSLLSFVVIFAQFGLKSNESGAGFPFFTIGHNEVYNDNLNKAETEIRIEIAYDDLSFSRTTDSEFNACYEINFVLEDKEGKFIANEFKTVKVNTKDFLETNSSTKHDTKVFTFVLEPKEYKATVLIEDKFTNRKFIDKYVFTPTSQCDLFTVSNLEFYDLSEGEDNLKPVVNQTFNNRDGRFKIAFVTNFRDTSIDSIYYDIKIVSDINGKVAYKNLSKNVPKDGKNDISIIFSKSYFQDASYTFKVKAYLDNDNFIEKSAKFSFVWYKYPTSKSEMISALNHMKHIAPTDSIKHYQNSDLDMSQLFFINTWKSMTRNKTENEAIGLMNEYFSRVQLANQSFSNYGNNGWITDRGRILIKFGKPDEVQRYPFQNNSKPFIVWKYYQDQRYFVFMDYGFNDYRITDDTRRYEYQ